VLTEYEEKIEITGKKYAPNFNHRHLRHSDQPGKKRLALAELLIKVDAAGRYAEQVIHRL
jgi:hypothetical protein